MCKESEEDWEKRVRERPVFYSRERVRRGKRDLKGKEIEGRETEGGKKIEEKIKIERK